MAYRVCAVSTIEHTRRSYSAIFTKDSDGRDSRAISGMEQARGETRHDYPISIGLTPGWKGE